VAVTPQRFARQVVAGLAGPGVGGLRGREEQRLVDLLQLAAGRTHAAPAARNRRPGAQDGWYAETGGNLHAGLKGGWRAGAVELVARAGVTRTETLQSLDLPFYATLGANYRF